MIRSVPAGTLLAIVALVGLTGCGADGPNRGEVVGHVTFDGEPVAKGRVVLRPKDKSSGPTAGAAIENGTFTIPRDTGPALGVMRVEIRAERGTGEMAENLGAKYEVTEQYIPECYNANSTLEIAVDQARVEKTFALTSDCQ